MTYLVLFLLAASVGWMVRSIHDKNDLGATVAAIAVIGLTLVAFYRLTGGL